MSKGESIRRKKKEKRGGCRGDDNISTDDEFRGQSHVTLLMTSTKNKPREALFTVDDCVQRMCLNACAYDTKHVSEFKAQVSISRNDL